MATLTANISQEIRAKTTLNQQLKLYGDSLRSLVIRVTAETHLQCTNPPKLCQMSLLKMLSAGVENIASHYFSLLDVPASVSSGAVLLSQIVCFTDFSL